MAINLYSKASVDSLLSAKLSISSLTNAAATTLNATAPTTGQVLSFDGTELKWATPAGGATWGSITGTLSSQSDLNTALNARVSTAGDTMDNNALLEFNDTVTNSHLGINGNGVTVEGVGGLAGLSSTLDMDKLSITDGTDTAEFNLAGINFADGTVQTTAYTGGATPGSVTYSSPYLFDTVTSSNIATINLGSGTLTANVINAANATLNGSGLTLTASSGANITFADGTTQSTQPHDLPIGGTTGQVLTKNSATNYDASWATAGGGGVDVQTFGSSSSSGSFTWTKPAGAKLVFVLLVGAGGGGGSGARQATTSGRAGGGGGSSGSVYYGFLSPALLGATETVVVAAGGAGGASITTNTTNGATPTRPSATTFSNFKAVAGQVGSGGTTASGAAGGAITSIIFGPQAGGTGGGGGTTSNGSAATDGNTPQLGTGGGGGGGAAASSTVAAFGGNGAGVIPSNFLSGIVSTIAGGSRGTNVGVQATAGTSQTTNAFQIGTGGGGGFYITNTAGGTGGNGGWPGGGGGGGGASDNGFNSGAGGNGANGFAVVITYF